MSTFSNGRLGSGGWGCSSSAAPRFSKSAKVQSRLIPLVEVSTSSIGTSRPANCPCFGSTPMWVSTMVSGLTIKRSTSPQTPSLQLASSSHRELQPLRHVQKVTPFILSSSVTRMGKLKVAETGLSKPGEGLQSPARCGPPGNPRSR